MNLKNKTQMENLTSTFSANENKIGNQSNNFINNSNNYYSNKTQIKKHYSDENSNLNQNLNNKNNSNIDNQVNTNNQKKINNQINFDNQANFNNQENFNDNSNIEYINDFDIENNDLFLDDIQKNNKNSNFESIESIEITHLYNGMLNFLLQWDQQLSIPANLEYEQLLSALIYKYPSILENKIEQLQESYYYFWNKKNQAIFNALLKILKKERNLTSTIILDTLSKNKIIKKFFKNKKEVIDYFNNILYLNYLENKDILVEKIREELLKVFDFTINTLKDAYIRRTIITESLKNLALNFYTCNNQAREMEQITQDIEQFQKNLSSILSINNNNQTDFVSAEDALNDLFDYYQEMTNLREDDSNFVGVATKIQSLDKMTKGLHPGNLIIVAGRPSMGKTAFALNIAQNVSYNSDKNVAIFSLEMSVNEVIERTLISKLNPNIMLDKLKNIDFDSNDWEQLDNIRNALNNKQITLNAYIDESSVLTPFIIEQKLARLNENLKANFQRVNLVVIDYLQLMSCDDIKQNNRNAEISSITRSLKIIARKFNVPIILLSQLSRKVEERVNKRPLLSDLRDSGAIEQDADLILMLYRSDYYTYSINETPEENQSQDSTVEVIIAKHRNGSTGTINLNFNKSKMLFTDCININLDEDPNNAYIYNDNEDVMY